MAISANLQQGILGLTLGTFNMSAGGSYLSNFANYAADVQTKWNLTEDQTMQELARALVSSPAFQEQMAGKVTAADQAMAVLTNFGLQGDAALLASTTAAIASFPANNLNGSMAALIWGYTKGLMQDAAVQAMYPAAAATFANKLSVSTFLSATNPVATTDVAALKATLATVTADPATAQAVIDSSNGSTFTLTENADTATANIFNSTNKFFAGTGYVNTLNDNDRLTGTGTNPTLNVELGASNDIDEDTQVQPTLTGIETVNVQFINSGDSEAILNLRDATGIENVNITRITDNSAAANVTEMDASATNLSLSDATRGGLVTFSHKEEVLTSTTDALSLATSNVRLQSLTLNEAGDAVADTGFYFENINWTATGTNDLDAMTIAANTREDVVAGNAADTTKQHLEITAGAAAGATGSLEINTLNATGVDTMVIHANHRVDIALDKAAALAATNGLNAADLETLTIDGAANVRIDGVEGQVGVLADTQGLTVNGSAMTGNLRIGVVGTTAVDDLFNLTSGTGNDEVRAFGSLGGDVVTGVGTDTVTVDANMTGTASVSTGTGNDTVTATDMLATATDKDLTNNGGYDDVQTASITTGDGDDTVTVGEMNSASDWDNITITDGNLNDLQVVKGAQVSTGAGADTVTARNLLEGAKVDTGEGDDTFTVSLNAGNATVFAEDTNADVITLVTNTLGVADGTASGRTDEVNTDGTVNRVGAELDMGAGTADVANFTETETITNAGGVIAESGTDEYTIVARDALVSGAETMNVTARDAVIVTVDTSMADFDSNAAGVQTDINANVVGTQVANFTIVNQIIDNNAANNVVSNTVLTASTVNDDVDTDGAIIADVLRFDTALTTINLVSEEQIVQTGAATEVYQAGTATAFTLKNLREGVALSLTAHEATNNAATTVSDDTLLSIDMSANSAAGLTAATYGNISNATNAAADVTMTLNYDASSETNDSASINIGGTATATNGAFDVLFALGAATTDTTDDAASASDDDTDQLENFTINVTDARTHSFDMGGYGDNDFGALAANGTNAAVTSLTVNTDGASVQVDNVNTDTIRFNNAAGTAVTAANVTLRVDANNNYNIVTGSGTDIIDMRADTVRAFNTATTAGADTISAGTGRDTLFVAGNNDMSSNDLNYGVVNVATVINDDVFANISGVEVLTIDSGIANAAAQDLTLDEAARTAGIDTVNLIDTDAVDNNQGINLVIGNNFAVAANTGDNANGELTAADAALVINASSHQAQTTLSIENKDDDTDVAFVNMDVRMNALGGAILNFANTGDQNGTVEVRVATGTEDTVHTIGSAADGADAGAVEGSSTGEVDINVTTGSFDKLVLVEGLFSNDDDINSTNLNNNVAEGAMTIVIEADWTRGNGTAAQNTFELDASAVADTDANSATGGATITVEDADTATLTIKGTANDDNITGGVLSDTITGNAGNDTINGDVVTNVNDVLTLVNQTYRTNDSFSVTLGGITVVATVGAANATYDLDGAGGLPAVNVPIAGNIGTSRADILSALQTAVIAATTASPATENWSTSIDVSAGTLTLTQTLAQQTAADADITASTFTAAAATQQSTTVTFNNVAAAITTVDVSVTLASGATTSYGVTGTDFDTAMADIEALMDAAGYATTYTAATDTFVVAGGAAMTQGFSVTATTNDTSYSVTTNTTATYAAATTHANNTFTQDVQVIGGAADSIDGGTGNDVIQGMVGADTLNGGDGTDTLSYASSDAAVTVNLATSAVSGGHAAGDVISNFENVTGSAFADTLTGSDAANALRGLGGNDTINGGAGADSIVFEATAAANGADTINGFTSGTDTLDVDAYMNTIVKVFEAITDDGADITTNANVIAVGGAATIAAAAAAIAADATVTGTTGIIIVDDNVNSYVYYTDNLAGDGTETLVATLVGVTAAEALVAGDFTFA